LALFGIVLVAALAANLALVVVQRHWTGPFVFSLLALLLLAGSLAVFFTWTYPAIQITANWAMAPENWQDLRRQWEYSHAVNALLTFLSFWFVTLSVLLTPERNSP